MSLVLNNQAQTVSHHFSFFHRIHKIFHEIMASLISHLDHVVLQKKMDKDKHAVLSVQLLQVKVNVYICSLAVFEGNVEVLSLLSAPLGKTLTFSNISVISVITKDIYLKLRLIVYYQKWNPYQ